MSLTNAVSALLLKLTPTAIESVKTILESAVASGDSERYLKRMALAQATKAVAKKSAEKILAETKKK